jgi:hypothetical protein
MIDMALTLAVLAAFAGVAFVKACDFADRGNSADDNAP